MENKVQEYLKLSDEIRQLQSVQNNLQKDIIEHITAQDIEQMKIGIYDVKILYKKSYTYDIEPIRKILEPKGVFEQISATTIYKVKLDSYLFKKQDITEDEYEELINSIHIKYGKEYLKVDLHGIK